MKLSRRDMARLAGVALASSGLASVSAGALAGAQTPEPAPDGSTNADLLALLSFIPLSLVEENYGDGYELATFGDSALRLASVGVEAPESPANTEDVRGVFQATLPVPYGNLVQATVRADDPLSLLGWTILDVHQSLYTMTSAGLLHVMRGSFDQAALEAAWTTNGYQMLDIEGHPAASLSAEGDMDFDSEIGRLTLGGANNAALLEDGTLLYSPTLDALTAMLQAHDGTLPSLSTYALVEAVVSPVTSPLSGASLLPGPAFMAPFVFNVGEQADLDLEELEELPEPGPLPLMGLVGFVSGPSVPDPALEDADIEPAPSGSKMVASLKYTTAEEAAIAARRALVELETGVSAATQVPFVERFAGWRVAHRAGDETILVEIDLYGDEGVWLQMIYNREASFLYS